MDYLEQPLNKCFAWRKLQPLGIRVTLDTLKKENLEPFSFCNAKKCVGIEVEVENIRKVVTCNQNIWHATGDGSLRNYGFEFISRPIAGHAITLAIHNLFQSLPEEADFSERTSIHVHVNVRDLTIGQLLGTLILGIVFEKLLYQFAGPSRIKNVFCVPIHQTKFPYTISQYFTEKSLPNLIHQWRKYSGINLAPVKSLGTIEYRQMEGHCDPVRLLNWINLLLRIHTYVKRKNFMQIYSEVKMLNTNSLYEAYVRQVFRKSAEHLLGLGDIRKLMEHGVSVAKAVALPSPFFVSLLSEMSDKSNLLSSIGFRETDKRIYKSYSEHKSIGNVLTNRIEIAPIETETLFPRRMDLLEGYAFDPFDPTVNPASSQENL